MEFTQEQLKIIGNKASSVVIGAAGTGKTTTLVAKVQSLIADGEDPKSIYVAAFSYRSMLMLRHFLFQAIGKKAEQVTVGTFRDFSLSVLQQQSKDMPAIADHATIRRCLKQAVAETGFEGSTVEAEHIIRSFKARARKPDENEQYYPLLLAFKNFMEQTGMIDRYDIVRKHIVGMRNDVYQPCQIKYLLVDNIQDATQIQFLWLFEHLKTGVNLTAFGDDDLCLFENDGAIGSAAFFDLEELDGVSKLTLSQNFRISKNIGDSVFETVSKLKGHIEKENKFTKKEKTKITVKTFDTVDKELEHVVTRIQAIQKKNPDTKIAVLVRSDYQANRMSYVLNVVGVEHACVSPSLWDMPGAIMVLDLLEVILNTASDEQLFNTLVCLGLNRSLVDSLFANGMQAKDWLKTGAMLPEHVDLPLATLQEYGALQRKLTGYYVAMFKGEIKPQELFKAIAYEIIVKLEGEEQRDALMAVEALMGIKGNPAAVLKHIKNFETPDMRHNVVVSPIREVRNWEFDWVFMPFSGTGVYPYAGYKVIKQNIDHEKKVVYMALTRAKKAIEISSTGELSDILKKVEARVQQPK
jgi:superfamily I DNA/RNA helicase